MKPTKLTSAALALALAAVLGTSAHAQNATFNKGDVLIGFEQTGASNDYVVDLGSVSQFINAGPGTVLTYSLSSSDLSNTFGSTWASNSQTNLVQWGLIGGSQKTGGNLIVGGDTLAQGTLFYTVGELTPGTQSTAPTEGSTALQNTVLTNIANLDSGSGGFLGTTTTAGSTASLNAVNLTNGATNSYSFEINNTYFGSGTNIQQPLTGLATGPTNSVLDLYRLNPVNGGTAILLGTVSLASTGALTFTEAGSAAVPEPSTYALLLGGLGLLAWRLRSKAVAAV